MKRLILAVPIFCSACGAVYTPNMLSDGHIAVIADAPGMRAMMDGMNGLVTNGKASPDKDTAHWIHRKAEEREHTMRETSPSFMDNLFAPSMPTSSQEGS